MLSGVQAQESPSPMPVSLPILAPNTGRVFHHWQPTPRAEIARAVAIVDRGLDGLETVERRRDILARCAEALVSGRRTLADLVVREVGKKPEEALGEVDYAASFLKSAHAALDELVLERRPEPGRLIREVPYRAALLIAPFNDPLAGLTRKIGPALAAGATVLVKPSRLGILCAQALIESFHEAGARDFIQLVAPQDNGIVEALIPDRRIGAVSFTGSTGAGRRLAVAAAREGKRAVLELGGNCPFVVCEDARLDLALEDLMARKLKAAGQACSSVNRVFVAARRYAEFRDRLVEHAARIEPGPSVDPGVELGPLRTREATRALSDAVDRAVRGGERLLSQRPGPAPPEAPFLFPFTVVECDDRSWFDTYESFGPVLSIRPFDTLDALLRRMEAERHALAAYFHTADPEALLPRLRRLRFGSLGLNSTAIQGADVPTGGFRDAGIGREGGIWGVREFLTPVNCRMARDQVSIPRWGS